MKLASLVRDVPPVVGEALFLEARGKLNLSTDDTVGHAFHYLQPLFFANLGWSQGLRQPGLH